MTLFEGIEISLVATASPKQGSRYTIPTFRLVNTASAPILVPNQFVLTTQRTEGNINNSLSKEN